MRIAAAERKQALVEAALAVIVRDGVAGASTRAITAEAGMSLASFHYVFPSRDALLAEVIERALEQEVEVQTALVVDGLPLDERVYRGFVASIDLLAQRPRTEMALFELMHFALRSPDLGALARRQYQRYWEIAERFVTDSGATWDRPPREIAQMVVALNDGIALAWLATRDTDAVLRMAAVATAAICSMSVSAP